MAEMQVVPWVLNAQFTFPVAISVMFCPAHVQTQTKSTRGYCVMMASTNGFGMFSSYTLLFPRHVETRTLARLECETVKQLHPDKCFCFRFRRHMLGGAFFSHVLLALMMFDMTPWSCNMLSRSQKMCPHFCMAGRFCGLRHSRWGGAFPSLVLIGTHGMDQFYHVAFTLASASRKHQRLVVNCRCCSWCAATMQLIGLFLQIQSSWHGRNVRVYACMFFCPKWSLNHLAFHFLQSETKRPLSPDQWWSCTNYIQAAWKNAKHNTTGMKLYFVFVHCVSICLKHVQFTDKKTYFLVDL